MKIRDILLTGVMGLSVPGLAAAQEYVLRIAIASPPAEDAVNGWIRAFEEGVEAASDGRIDVQLYYGGQLGAIPATIEGTAMGTIEMAFSLLGFLSGLDPRYQVLDSGALFESDAHANRVLRDLAVREMFAGFGEGTGVELFGIFTNGQIAVAAREPLDDLAAFEGLKVRVGGASPLVNQPLEDLGAAPISFSLGEVLPAIQTGVLDASIANLQVFTGLGFADVADQATYLPGSYLMVTVVISEEFLARIGPELEAIVREQGEAAYAAFDARLAEDRTFYEQAWVAAGGTVVSLPEHVAEAYQDRVRETVAGVLAGDDQLRADYEILLEATERQR